MAILIDKFLTKMFAKDQRFACISGWFQLKLQKSHSLDMFKNKKSGLRETICVKGYANKLKSTIGSPTNTNLPSLANVPSTYTWSIAQSFKGDELCAVWMNRIRVELVCADWGSRTVYWCTCKNSNIQLPITRYGVLGHLQFQILHIGK